MILYLSLLFAVCHCAVISTRQNIINFNLDIGKEAKRTLGFPEDAYLNFTELVNKHGHPVEEHTAVSEDGFVNKLFRIGKNKGPPVVLVHGLVDSPDLWILPGPRKALSYQLVDSGFDVWAVDFRGSRYTRKHVYLDPDKDVKFWKWGPDEISRYDIPAMIKYILDYRNVSSLSYIGHSLGCRLFYQIGAYKPSLFRNVDVMISIAPSAWSMTMFNPGLRFISRVVNELEAIGNHLGLQEVLGSHSLLNSVFLQLLCARVDKNKRSLNENFCAEFLSMNYGPDREQLSEEMIPVIFGHSFCGTSLQTLAHMGQGLYSPNFQRYDHGFKGNMRYYGTPSPLEYDVKLVTTPVAIFSGKNDWLSSLEDIKPLKKDLPNLIEHHIVPREKWNHVDHIWGKEAPELVNARILGILEKYTKFKI